MRSLDSQGPDSSTDTLPSPQPESDTTSNWAKISTGHAPPAVIDAGANTDPVAAIDPAAPSAAGIPDLRYIQHYELIRELGRGGMGVVHLARDLRLGRLVAIKMLTRRGQLQDRFLAEARATARCHHENIVVIHEVGIHGEQPYLVFEYLRGQTLRQWMDTRLSGTFDTQSSSGSFGPRPAPLTARRAVEMIVPVVRALVCAHDMGIIHRDLKPANVLLTDEGVTKVLDFGVAKIGAAREDVTTEAAGASAQPLAITALGARLGTLPYMSPEQIAGESVDHRSDVWAVGIILYELVTGAHPLAPLSPVKLEILDDLATPMPSVREHRSDLGPLADIIDRCLLKDREHRTATARELLQELEALLPAQRTHARDEDSNPFAGLAAFQEPDVDRFFGRDHDITSLIGKLRTLPLLALTGPSGAGKSSLVRAGLIPALKRSGEGWEAIVTRPGRQPLAALAQAVLALPGRPSEEQSTPELARGADPEPAERDAILARLRTEPGYLGIALRTWARAKLRRLVLFVDQFEELYTLGADAEERACVLACLSAVADDAASPLRVILSIRSDFLDRLAEQRAFLDAVTQGLTFLSPLDRDGLREALVRPLEACDHRFESQDMVERILDELEATRSPLPLLQFTADKLWARRDRRQRRLTEASLRALGGVTGALASHADAVLASMPAQDARLARAVFLRLVTPERTRALATLAELRQLGRDPESMSRVLTRLIDARLLSIESVSASAAANGGSDGMAEIVHESLIVGWPLLGQWLVESEEDAIFLSRLRSATREWQRSGHAPGLLWTGQAARDALAWRRRYQGPMAPAEEQYLTAVFAAAERARRFRQQVFGGSFSIAVALAVAMAWLAWREASARQVATDAATEARQEAMRARDATRIAVARSLPEDPTTQLALLREIESTSELPPGAAQEARRLLHASVARVVLTGDDAFFSVAFSPDGHRVVTASYDKTVRVWNADGTGKPLVLRGHDEVVWESAFSPDGHRIVSTSADKTVRVWNADGTGEPLVLHGHDDGVGYAEFSPDGKRIVSASYDKTVRVWNADGTGEPLVLRGHDSGVTSAAFSPDGQRIVSSSQDRTVRVWNADGTGEPLVLRGHDGTIRSAAFSPDGQRIVSASRDTTVRVWNADGTGEPMVLRGHDDDVLSAQFSPDGQRIVSASRDKTVRVWSADGTGAPLVLRGHEAQVSSASFSLDGQRIVSASYDKTVRVWNTQGRSEPLALRGHDDTVISAQFSPDGQRIVSASYDKTVRVWNNDGRSEPLTLRGHDDRIAPARFSPDGQRIVSASLDKTVRVWNADGTGEPLVLRGHNDGVTSAEFSPDGRRIVSASSDKTVRVWNTDGTGEPLVLRGHDEGVVYAQFNPDGRRIVSASLDKTVRVWSTDGAGEPLVLRGHDDRVGYAEFSPDGKRILSMSFDQTVRVWNADGTGEPLVLRHDKEVTWVAFSPDSQRIVSASLDKTVRVWHADGTGEPLVLRGHNDYVSSAMFSPSGMHIVSASGDATIRIWKADGTGEPIILNHSDGFFGARFSPDGQRIVSVSADHAVLVWHELGPAPVDDPRLWTATTYCMPIERRIQLLGFSEETARRDRQRCLERVEQVRRAQMLQP